MKQASMVVLFVVFALLLVTTAVVSPQTLSDVQFVEELVQKSPWKAEWSGTAYSGTFDVTFVSDGGRVRGFMKNWAYIVAPPSHFQTSPDGELLFLKVGKGRVEFTFPDQTTDLDLRRLDNGTLEGLSFFRITRSRGRYTLTPSLSKQ